MPRMLPVLASFSQHPLASPYFHSDKGRWGERDPHASRTTAKPGHRARLLHTYRYCGTAHPAPTRPTPTGPFLFVRAASKWTRKKQKQSTGQNRTGQGGRGDQVCRREFHVGAKYVGQVRIT